MFAKIYFLFKQKCIVTSGFENSMSTHHFRAGHMGMKTNSTHVMHMVIFVKFQPRI